ncbi:MAG: DUF177 domain-containing protein [Pseudomonadales bacterium]|nr:DUF177 domain-containing protein [Pseudomonadales bacterium]
MATPPDERLPYAVLARQGARLERSLQPGSLARLDAIAPARGPVVVGLEFRRDGEGRCWVRGRASQRVDALCHRCLERFERELEVGFDLCIVPESADLTGTPGVADLLTVGGDTVSVADIVEDELLLGLPERLCLEDPCPHMPVLVYPAVDAAEMELGPDMDLEMDVDEVASGRQRNRPFDILAQLKRSDS